MSCVVTLSLSIYCNYNETTLLLKRDWQEQHMRARRSAPFFLVQTVKRKEATKRTENERKPVDIGCTTTYNETF